MKPLAGCLSARVLLFCIIFFGVINAHAACRVDPGLFGNYSPPVVNLDFNQLVVAPSAQPGDVLATARGSVAQRSNLVRCDLFGGGTQGDVLAPPSAFSPDIFNSGVPGVGIRLRQRPSNNPRGLFVVDPYEGANNSGFSSGLLGFLRLDLPELEIIAEAVRTAEPLTAGTLRGGTFSRFVTDNGDADTIFTTRLNGRVVGSTCEVSGPRNISVTLPPVSITMFEAPGSTAGQTPFEIALSCNGIEDARDRVAITLDYSAAGALADRGVIANAATRNAARGIGIQVLDGAETPAPPNTPVDIRALRLGRTRSTLSFAARYYQTETAPSAGQVQAMARFMIVYP